ERRTYCSVCGVVRRDVAQCDPAQLGSKARPKRKDFHRRSSTGFVPGDFHLKAFELASLRADHRRTAAPDGIAREREQTAAGLQPPSTALCSRVENGIRVHAIASGPAREAAATRSHFYAACKRAAAEDD